MSFDMMKQDPSMVTGEEDENFEEWQVIPAVQIGMTQHEPIFKCTKRAVEKILFSYALPANEIYEAVLGYKHDPEDLPTHQVEVEFDIPDVKNGYSKALMNIIAEFCIDAPKSLSLGEMAAAAKRYDEVYLKRRWKTQYEVFKAIFVEIPEQVNRKKLFFSECILYATLLVTTHGRATSALNEPLGTPWQKTRARKWLKSVAEVMFSEKMKNQFRIIVSWYIEGELLKEAEDLGLLIVEKNDLVSGNKYGAIVLLFIYFSPPCYRR